MRYSPDKPFENREHIVWEIGFGTKFGTSAIILALVFIVLGIIGDLLNMKLGLGSTSWLHQLTKRPKQAQNSPPCRIVSCSASNVSTVSLA